eukprot:1389983-Amorphochlora_amoeboformis.AAC.1
MSGDTLRHGRDGLNRPTVTSMRVAPPGGTTHYLNAVRFLPDDFYVYNRTRVRIMGSVGSIWEI